MVSSSFFLCDVFAEQPFAGNPLAVFLDAEGVSDAAMAELAREFGWSEITFVQHPAPHGLPSVRIWSPQGELPFAGHPTIGTAVVLATHNLIVSGWSALDLAIGRIAINVTDLYPGGGTATMVQRRPEFGESFLDLRRLARSLGLDTMDLVPGLPAQIVSTGAAHFLVPVRTIDALQRATPSPDIFPGVIAAMGARWAYVFSLETPQSTAAARARLLTVGREDAATGSAAGPLGAYLVQHGLHRPGVLDIEQGIEMGRPSRICVDVVREDGDIAPVRVSGHTCIWGEGHLEIPDPASRTLGL